jgi:hypothetical protein
MRKFMWFRSTVIGMLILMAAGCVAISTVEPLSVPMLYKSTPDNDALLVSLSCPYLAHVQVLDKRSESVLGVRYLESKPLKADVTADGDPVAWVQGGIQQYLGQSHIKTGEVGPTLVLELDSLKTSENIYHRSGYEARIIAVATLQSPMGKSCWHASVQSDAGNYGYAGSIEDYQEVLNRALDKISWQILGSADFSTALCHCAD